MTGSRSLRKSTLGLEDLSETSHPDTEFTWKLGPVQGPAQFLPIGRVVLEPVDLPGCRVSMVGVVGCVYLVMVKHRAPGPSNARFSFL